MNFYVGCYPKKVTKGYYGFLCPLLLANAKQIDTRHFHLGLSV